MPDHFTISSYATGLNCQKQKYTRILSKWSTIKCPTLFALSWVYTCFMYSPLTELHLAALLGKTLLEQNEELELKNKKLQESSEEAVKNSEVLLFHNNNKNLKVMWYLVYVIRSN